MKKLNTLFFLFLPLAIYCQSYFEDFESPAANTSTPSCGFIINPSSFTNPIGVSHGTPRLANELHVNPSGCGNTKGILIETYAGSCGEGFYLGYNFQAGKKYQIEFTSKIWSGSQPGADLSQYHLSVRAANSIPSPTGGCYTNNCLQLEPSSGAYTELANYPYTSLGSISSCVTTYMIYEPTSTQQQLWFTPHVYEERHQIGLLIDNVTINEITDNDCQLYDDFIEGDNIPSSACLATLNPNSVAGLHISHGTPRFANDCANQGIYMGIENQACGEGVYFDCSFEQGNTYEITFTTNIDPLPPNLALHFMRVAAAVGLQTNPNLVNCSGEGSSSCAGTPPPAFVIDGIAAVNFTNLGNPTGCVTNVITYTPTPGIGNLNQLWIYPTNASTSGKLGALILNEICVRNITSMVPNNIDVTDRGSEGTKSRKIGQNEASTDLKPIESIASIYPNPTSSGVFNIDLSDLDENLTSIKVYDSFGRLLISQETTLKNTTIDLPANGIHHGGCFWVKIEQGNKSILTEKIMVLSN